jgi:hypothetical protein
MWSRSPDLQREIQPPPKARLAGVGAQQAMVPGGRVLPWIPDILGRDWCRPESLLIIGAAYGPFVQGFARRTQTVSPAVCENASTWPDFQDCVLRGLLEDDSSYYSRLMAFAAVTGQPTASSGIAVLNLCRTSFVERNATGRFRGGDGVVMRHCGLFERYVEHPQNQSWLWRRVTGTGSTRIIAVGAIAEHGLLRLFMRQRCELRIAGTLERLRTFTGGAWVKHYARPRRQLSFWTDRSTWWGIRGMHRGQERVWRLLPIAHPADSPRHEYVRERELVAGMLASAGG